MALQEKYNSGKMTKNQNEPVAKLKDMQLIIGWVLRVGVIASVTVVCFGAVFYLYRHGHSLADYSVFKGVPGFVEDKGIIQGILTLKGRAIIQAGIILLIATPILRVVCSFAGFAFEKDYLYTGITLLVLLIIFMSMLGGHAA
jgi:uncharacterized membrane protein